MFDIVKCPNCGQVKNACFGLEGCWNVANKVAQADYMPKQLAGLYEKGFVWQTELGSRSAEALHIGQEGVRTHLEMAYSAMSEALKHLGQAMDVAE